MIEKIRQDYQFNTETFEVSCDTCDEVQEYDCDFGWEDLMKQMKNDGWVSKKVDGDWEHYCSDCITSKEGN